MRATLAARAALTMTLLTALALGGCGTSGAASGSDGAEASGNLPPFQAFTVTGEAFDLGEHLGRDVVVMSFWATWCEPCKAEMPTLQALHDEYGAQGLQIVSISIDDAQTQSAVRPYIANQGYTFPVVIDEDSSIVQAYNTRAVVPYMLFVGRDGRISKRVTGFKPAESADIEREVRALLGLDG